MPRPSKHVSLKTLGGRIRAAREQLHLSLADVANGHYSTSLISQIERNRIEPSQESLRFLADRLDLPLKDLETLARQHRTEEIENNQYKSFEELRLAASELLTKKDCTHALMLLHDLSFPQIPAVQRWRLAALRGQCYFEQRKFLKAQHDFVYAANEQPQPDGLPPEQMQELLLLHLHLAGAYRELCQLEAALEQYKTTLHYVNSNTPFGHVAEIHWGMALIAYAQANQMSNTFQYSKTMREKHLQSALEHAENARFLYRSIESLVQADTVTCHIAHIERKLGAVDKVHHYLQEVLTTWTPVLDEPSANNARNQRQQQEIANIVSSAAYSLANIELEAGKFDQALTYSDLALAAGKRSYKRRRADAYLLRGRILEAINLYDPEVEQAFRCAIEEIQDTDRIAARISTHVRIGQHLLKIGKEAEGEQHLEQAHLLSEQVSVSSPASTETEDNTFA
jgi:transcriptional regulator with XRE-family HTH domain